jgi:hypothetical protein
VTSAATATALDAECRHIVAEFDRGRPPEGAFDHHAHVHVTWCYLRMAALTDVLERLPAALRRIASEAGVPQKYHETTTWAFTLAVAERLTDTPDADWHDFEAAHPDLFGPLLERYYRPETLASPRARQHFVMPDRWG